MHSFLSSISRRVCKILMHSFSSLSISFLVCLISLSGGDKRAQSATFMPPIQPLVHNIKTKRYFIDEVKVSESSRKIIPRRLLTY